MTLRQALAALAASGSLFATRADAQQRVQSEVRIDALLARTNAVHASAGANAVAGTYARIGLLAGAGVRRIRDKWRSSGRLDAVARMHVDPLRQHAWGAYAGGGATLLFDEHTRTRARVLVVVGYEGPVTPAGWIAGIEAGVGGGLRIALTARRARDVGR
jgi:hypothetical protein